MEKNQECIIKIEDMSLEGEGVGRLDGYALFVKDTVIGDEVRVKIIKANKTYGYARLMEVITPSSYRVTARCPLQDSAEAVIFRSSPMMSSLILSAQ